MDIEKKWNYLQNLHSKTDWYRYYGEYSAAIDNLLERSDQSQSTVLALPLLYLIRHSIELAFKMNLIELQKISGQKATIDYSGKKAHVLHKLHSEFENQVNEIIKQKYLSHDLSQEFKKRNKRLKDFTKIFDLLDNWSYAFRYPVKNDGKTKSFKVSDEINISDIIPVYEETKTTLKYTTDVLVDSINGNR